MKNKIIIMIMIILLIVCFSSIVLAGVPSSYGNASVSGPGADMVKLFGGIIVGSIRTVGMIISVSALMYMGIRFMLAAPSEKANIKGALTPYIVGSVLVFATSLVLTIIYNLRIT